nr:calcium/proton exchanger [Tanacetum cinerariifolium]
NGWRKLIVYCGRGVEAGRCDGSKTNEGTSKSSKNQVKVTTISRSKTDEGTSKSLKTPVKAITSGEGCFESPKWTKSKSLKPEHKYSRNYNLGSLVTYKWISHHYAKRLIADPFIPYLKMKNGIREKFLINVSLGQCKRAKQRALFNYERGLREHYRRLWEYRQAILDSNPGTTCRLEDEETESGNYYFRRFYVFLKGVKEGWLAGCRKVIGMDCCFLKHTYRGELLVAMGRDVNNHMYPIAWAVVKVESNENW